ncbi:P450 monooxygenase [Apiospora marii]|uniref:P450 monooxygenase n=1 Tax=Apiospora marii TaxID=335849 RepID=A0ABR1RQE7_9PEZI
MSDVILFLFSSLCAALIWSWLNKPSTPKGDDSSNSSSDADKFPCADSSWPILCQWRSLTSSKSILHNVYQKQLVDHQPYTLSGMFGDAVVLPPSMLPWLLAQPEHHLSAKWAQLDALNIPQTFLRPDIGIHPVHEPLIRRTLTAHLDGIAGALHEEVALALDELWGTSKGNTEAWREVNLDYTIRRVVARASNRVFVGLPLCRNNDYIENCISYATWVSSCGLLISSLPRWLKDSLGMVFTAPIRMVYSRCSNHLLPLFRDLAVGDATEMSSPSRQNLFSSWLVHNSTKLPADSPERTPDYLSRRIMALNFAAIHTSTLTTVNLLLDLFSTSPSHAAPAPPYSPEAASASEEMISLLRDEALDSRAHWGGDDRDPTAWSRARLNQMPRLDSALRESMRRWGLVPKALSRKIMPASRGVSLPDGHGLLPPGTIVCVSGWGLHHDESLYARPFEFVWDRFLGGSSSSSSASASGSAGGEEEEKEEADDARATAAAAAETDRQFAAWGIGKHACPGRFFAVDLIKIIVGKILTDYEVQLGNERPENIWIEYNVVPPPSATLLVRRRKAHA